MLVGKEMMDQSVVDLSTFIHTHSTATDGWFLDAESETTKRSLLTVDTRFHVLIMLRGVEKRRKLRLRRTMVF